MKRKYDSTPLFFTNKSRKRFKTLNSPTSINPPPHSWTIQKFIISEKNKNNLSSSTNINKNNHHLILKHWRRTNKQKQKKKRVGEKEEIYDTYEYNIFKKKQIRVFTYTDEEYDNYIIQMNNEDDYWTKEMTDELFLKCKMYDLRWCVVQDRLSFDKSLESIKRRYFQIARKLLKIRSGDSNLVSKHPISNCKYSENYENERKRKINLGAFYDRPRIYDDRENKISNEIKQIIVRKQEIESLNEEVNKVTHKKQKGINRVIPTKLDKSFFADKKIGTILVRSNIVKSQLINIKNNIADPKDLSDFQLSEYYAPAENIGPSKKVLFYSSKVQDSFNQLVEKVKVYSELKKNVRRKN